MGAPVVVVGVLVGVEVVSGVGGELAGDADGAVGAVGRVGKDDIGAVGGEDAFALDGNISGHAEQYTEAQRCAEHGVGDAGVAAGGVEEDFPGASWPVRCGFADDAGGGAVFDAAAGVVPLGFTEQMNAGKVAREIVERYERRVADAAEHGAGGGFPGSGAAATGEDRARLVCAAVIQSVL